MGTLFAGAAAIVISAVLTLLTITPSTAWLFSQISGPVLAPVLALVGTVAIVLNSRSLDAAKNKIEREKVALDREKVALEREKVDLENEKVTLSKQFEAFRLEASEKVARLNAQLALKNLVSTDTRNRALQALDATYQAAHAVSLQLAPMAVGDFDPQKWQPVAEKLQSEGAKTVLLQDDYRLAFQAYTQNVLTLGAAANKSVGNNAAIAKLWDDARDTISASFTTIRKAFREYFEGRPDQNESSSDEANNPTTPAGNP